MIYAQYATAQRIREGTKAYLQCAIYMINKRKQNSTQKEMQGANGGNGYLQ